MEILICLLAIPFLIYVFNIVLNKLHKTTKVFITSVFLILFFTIYFVGEEIGLILYVFLIFTILMLRFFVYGFIKGARNIKQERLLFTNIESKLRFEQGVARTEYKDLLNAFGRCIVSMPENQVKKDKSILIMPFLPSLLHLIDYNGNCVYGPGIYEAMGFLSNYAPYNELSDLLAKEGYLVIRMDMLETAKKQVLIAECLEDIRVWAVKIHKLYKITVDPIVIGHRDNGIMALEMMRRNNWKNGLFLCCGLNYLYSISKKSFLFYLRELTKEYRLLEIDAGIDRYTKKHKAETAEDVECDYKIIKINNMDYTLRRVDSKHKGEITDDGYKILCGTGEYPPISDELAREILNYLSEL